MTTTPEPRKNQLLAALPAAEWQRWLPQLEWVDTSLHPIPQGADEEALVMLSDILPTSFECGC